jgi:lactate dehydrogenase-like 2-hydroxyacid dehydrogenase
MPFRQYRRSILVDEAALIHALENKQIMGAALMSLIRAA